MYRPPIPVPTVLAIDLGTGGPKAALVDARGRTLAWTSASVATRILADGGAEQDPEEMWSAVVTAVRDVLAAVPEPPSIDAVAVTSQYMSVVPVRGDGTPTGPCIMWMDTRGAANNLDLLTDEAFVLFLERHGLIPLPSGNDNVAHISVLRDRHPEAYAAADAFVEPMDYVNARLTGLAAATQSTAFSLLCCDNRTWGASEYDPDLVAATRLDPRKLPPLMPLAGVIGMVTRTAAAELGVPAGTPVTAATIDSITSAVGTGAITPDRGSVVIGTTSVVVTHVGEKRGNLGHGLLTVPSPLRGKYYVMAENGVGGRALEWFVRLLDTSFESALAAAATVGPGSAGTQFLPWLLGSIAPHPEDDVRAAFVGLGLDTTRAHLARAVLEGVATNVAWLVPYVEDFAGSQYGVLRFGGGGAQSPLWAQILADATGRAVDRLAAPRATNARGAAFLALHDLGAIDIADSPGLLQVEQRHEPDPATREVMAALLRRHVELHPPLARLSRSGEGSASDEPHGGSGESERSERTPVPTIEKGL